MKVGGRLAETVVPRVSSEIMEATKLGVVSLILCSLLSRHVSKAYEVDLTVEINAGATECFWQRIKRQVSAELEYQVNR